MLTGFPKYVFMVLCLLLLGNSNRTGCTQESKAVDILADGVGLSPDAAKKNAFKNAVSRVVGSFVENETLVKNDKIINDSIYEYSGGFIEKFNVLSEGKDNDGLYRIKIKAVVIEKNLVEKLRTMKIDVKEVSGTSLKAQIDSQNDMRDNGKKILYSIMEQYPKLWNAKQILEPKIENGSLAISLEISVDKEKYLVWAETLCGIMDKSSDAKYLLSYKKGGHANYNKPLSRVLSKSPNDYFDIVVNDPYYYKATPQRIEIKEGLPKSGKIFSVIKEFSSDGNCEMVCYLIKTSNPLFPIFDSNNKSNRNNYLSFRFGDLFLPNQLELILLDSANKQMLKKIYRSPSTNGSSLWDSGSFHFAMNNSKGYSYLNPVTPFPFIQGFENGSPGTVYSTKCNINALIPTIDIEVEKISKITSGFSISK